MFRKLVNINLSFIFGFIKIHCLNLSAWQCLRRVFSPGVKRKAIPVTGRGGLQGPEMSRIPHRLENRLSYDGEVMGLMRPPSFTPEISFSYSFLLEAESTPERLEGLSKFKDSVTSLELEPATFWLVA
jgi:hypothetical protein